MKYKQIISKINKKKQNHEEFYEDLLLLEKEVNHCESLIKAQVLYFLGVDFLFYQDFKKALELQYDSLDLLINLVYTTREIEIVHFTIQKVIIEISKIYKKSESDGKESLSDRKKSDKKESKLNDDKSSDDNESKSNDNESEDFIIKSFYFNLKILHKHDPKLLNLIREFQDVKRVFPDNNEIFIYLLQENPRECLDFMTTDKQIDLLVDKLKTDFDFEIMKKLKLKNIQNLNNDDQRMDLNNQNIDPNNNPNNQSTNHIINIINISTPKSLINLLILFLIYDKDHFNDYLSQLRSLIIKSPSLIPILLTSCVSLNKIDILPEIVSLLPEEIKKNIKILYSDIYKVFSEEMDLDDLIDLEQVAHFWFTTGQYKKILKIEKKICKKLRFISKMREEDCDRDDGDDRVVDDMDNGDRVVDVDKRAKDRECVNRDKDSDMEDNPYNDDSDSDLDKIGFTWNLENDYVLEKIKFNLKNEKYGKIKKITREVKDLEILIKILGMVKEKMENEKEDGEDEGDDEEQDDRDTLPGIKRKLKQGHPKKNETDLVSLPNTKTKSTQENKKNEEDLVSLHKINPLKTSLLLKDILLDCFNRKDILFHGLKVFISYLHLKDLDFGVFERLRILNGVKFESISEGDKIWFQKVIYNNLIDVYNLNLNINVDNSINLLLNLPLTPDSFIISILLSSKSKINNIYSLYSKSQPSSFVSALFYGAYFKEDPLKAKDILQKIEFDYKSLLYLIKLEEVDPRIVIESHYKKLLTPSHLENIIMRLGLKGTLFLYEYLKSIIVI